MSQFTGKKPSASGRSRKSANGALKQSSPGVSLFKSLSLAAAQYRKNIQKIGGAANSLKEHAGGVQDLVEKASSEAAGQAPGLLELKGVAGPLTLPESTAAWMDQQGADRAAVAVQFGNMARGTMEIERDGSVISAEAQILPLAIPLFTNVPEALAPGLIVTIQDGVPNGYIGLGLSAITDRNAMALQIMENTNLLGLTGVKIQTPPKIVNKLEAGSLRWQLLDQTVKIGGAFEGKANLELVDDKVVFHGQAKVEVPGLTTGVLILQRNEEGVITGTVDVDVTVGENLSGKVHVSWDGRVLEGQGTIAYAGEKLSGSVTIHMVERGKAEQMEAEAQGLDFQPAPEAEPGKDPEDVDYAIFGEGDLNFSFTDWLTGTAHGMIDSKGHFTIIGEITPEAEVEIMKQKDYQKELAGIEARASYGIPVVGNVFVFAGISLWLFSKVGPATLHNIKAEGTYSTDPLKAKNFALSGTLNFSAAAGLMLKGEAGVGIELLAHDIKAGAAINAKAMIQGYAEARPTIGYREEGPANKDKKGDFFIKGDLEMAAQLALALGGELFVEIDGPWWSPVGELRETYPLGEKVWPLGQSMALLISVDYVIGSDAAPTIEFYQPEFDQDKFLSDLFNDDAEEGSKKTKEELGSWKDRNKAGDDLPNTNKQSNLKEGEVSEGSSSGGRTSGGSSSSKKSPGGDKNQNAQSQKTVEETRETNKKLEKDHTSGQKDTKRQKGENDPNKNLTGQKDTKSNKNKKKKDTKQEVQSENRSNTKEIKWWLVERKFMAEDGRNHRLYYTEKGGGYELALDTTQLKNWLSTNQDTNEHDKGTIKKAQSILGNIETLQKDLKAANKKTKSQKEKGASNLKDLNNKLNKKLNQLTKAMKTLVITPIPIPRFRPPPYSDNSLAASFKAEFITKEHVVDEGSNSGQHKGNLHGWPELQNAGFTGAKKDQSGQAFESPKADQVRERWVKMHLFTHRFGGKATDSNLTPARTGLNSGPMLKLENRAQAELTPPGKTSNYKAIWYKIQISYQQVKTPATKTTRSKQLNYLKNLAGKFGAYQAKKGKWVEGDTRHVFSVTVDPPNFDNAPNVNVHELHPLNRSTKVLKLGFQDIGSVPPGIESLRSFISSQQANDLFTHEQFSSEQVEEARKKIELDRQKYRDAPKNEALWMAFQKLVERWEHNKKGKGR